MKMSCNHWKSSNAWVLNKKNFGSSFIVRVISLFGLTLSCHAPAQQVGDLSGLVFDVVPLEESVARDITAGPGDVERDMLQQSAVAYREAIQVIEADGDLVNHELIELYDSLGRTLQGLEDHEAAIAAFENVVQITKVNDGLENLEQIPYIERLIESYVALGDMDSAENQLEYLYFLHQRNYSPTAPEMIDATMELADWNIAAYYRENFAVDGPGLRISNSMVNRVNRNVLGLDENEISPNGQPTQEFRGLQLPRIDSYYSQMMLDIFNGTVKDVNVMDVIDPRLRWVDRLYQHLQQNIYMAESAPAQLVLDIAARIAGLSFIPKQEMDFERINFRYSDNYQETREQEARNSQARLDESYRIGRNVLQYRVELLTGAGHPVALSDAQLELADWHLAYGKISPARDMYRQVYDGLVEAGFPVDSIDLRMSHNFPMAVPGVAPQLYSRESMNLDPAEPLEYRGYIDVSFNLTNQGNPDDIVILGRSGENVEIIEKVLQNYLSTIKYRPVLAGGELQSPGRIALRYYYSW